MSANLSVDIIEKVIFEDCELKITHKVCSKFHNFINYIHKMRLKN